MGQTLCEDGSTSTYVGQREWVVGGQSHGMLRHRGEHKTDQRDEVTWPRGSSDVRQTKRIVLEWISRVRQQMQWGMVMEIHTGTWYLFKKKNNDLDALLDTEISQYAPLNSDAKTGHSNEIKCFYLACRVSLYSCHLFGGLKLKNVQLNTMKQWLFSKTDFVKILVSSVHHDQNVSLEAQTWSECAFFFSFLAVLDGF